MVFGLSNKTEDKATKKSVKKDTSAKSTASTSQADEAAELLKKMEEKKAAGDCPFC